MRNTNRKVYISGGITGIPVEESSMAFAKAKAELAMYFGYKPKNIINPFELPEPEVPRWETYLERDLGVLCDCDDILMLIGWEKSKGACLEYEVAKAYGKGIYKYSTRYDIWTYSQH